MGVSFCWSVIGNASPCMVYDRDYIFFFRFICFHFLFQIFFLLMPSHIFCRSEFVHVTKFWSTLLGWCAVWWSALRYESHAGKAEAIATTRVWETEVFLFGSTLLGMGPGQSALQSAHESVRRFDDDGTGHCWRGKSMQLHQSTMDDSKSDREVADNTNLLFPSPTFCWHCNVWKMQSGFACFNHILLPGMDRYKLVKCQHGINQSNKFPASEKKVKMNNQKWQNYKIFYIWWCLRLQDNEYRVVVERFMHLSLAQTVSVQLSGSERHEHLAASRAQTRRAAPGCLFPFNIRSLIFSHFAP